MPSSTSSSDASLAREIVVPGRVVVAGAGEVAVTRPGFVRLTASDRPGIA
jgi:hypothetical protein